MASPANDDGSCAVKGLSTTIVVLLLVVATLVGITFTLRTTSRSGMPSKDVLERATRRARELEARERAEQNERED